MVTVLLAAVNGPRVLQAIPNAIAIDPMVSLAIQYSIRTRNDE